MLQKGHIKLILELQRGSNVLEKPMYWVIWASAFLWPSLGQGKSKPWKRKKSVFSVWPSSSFLNRIRLLPGHGVFNSLKSPLLGSLSPLQERRDTWGGVFFHVTLCPSTCHTAPLKGDVMDRRWCLFAIKINVTHWFNSLWSDCCVAP